MISEEHDNCISYLDMEEGKQFMSANSEDDYGDQDSIHKTMSSEGSLTSQSSRSIITSGSGS